MVIGELGDLPLGIMDVSLYASQNTTFIAVFAHRIEASSSKWSAHTFAAVTSKRSKGDRRGCEVGITELKDAKEARESGKEVATWTETALEHEPNTSVRADFIVVANTLIRASDSLLVS